MYTGPNVTNDNLVFGYDTGYGVANTAVSTRFYKGKPATNLASGLTKAFSNWNNLVGTTEYYTRNGSQGVHLVVTSGGGVRWHDSNQINNVSSSTQYTISATVKWAGVTPHPNLFYIRQYNSSGSQVTENGYFSTSYMIDLGDGWYRAYRTFTTTSTTDFVKLQGYQYAAGADIYYQDEQFELGALTPYTGDGATRSNTASLIDLKRTEDITVANVSFDSTGQSTFDGTNDYIELDDALNSLGNVATFEAVFKATETNNTFRVILGWGNGTSNYSGLHIGSWTSAYTDESLHFGLNSSTLQMFVRKGETFYKDNAFHHVIVTAGQNNYSIWIDGVEETFTFKHGSQSTHFDEIVGYNSNIDSQIGSRPYPTSRGYFKGDIPVVKVYDRILSDTEIKRNYKAYQKRFNI